MISGRDGESSALYGQKSWRVVSDCVEAFVTERGGMLAPVTFDRQNRRIQPYSIAPWHSEALDETVPGWHRVFRGDFFCLPFGLNNTVYRGEEHGVHGEIASEPWTFEGIEQGNGRTTLHLSFTTKVRPGRIDKFLSLVDGQNAVYCRHVISGMEGAMPMGHHAMLQLPEEEGSALISMSPKAYWQVFPETDLHPGESSYSALKAGARFESLQRVPAASGEFVDASRFPARPGNDDVMLSINRQGGPFAWSAASIPQWNYVWFALKDAAVLCSTLMWLSNGGHRLYPWNGRHRHRIALEEMTGNFHYGLAESAEPNALSAMGFTTAHSLSADSAFTVNYIMAVAPTSRGFGRVKSIEPGPGRRTVILTSASGQTVEQGLDPDFLRGG